MRKSEVSRLLLFLLSLLLVLPVLHAAWSLTLAAAFLAEFLSAGGLPALSLLTSPPARKSFPAPGAPADRYLPAGFRGGRPLVLVHGFAPEGKDDPRVREAATLLARAGFDVVVPTIPGLTVGRLRPDDAAPVVEILAARSGRTAVLGVSVGAGPAVLAAADPRVRDRVHTVVTLGGYASARELLRFYLTGRYAYDGAGGRVTHDPRLVEMFVAANRDLVDERIGAFLAARDDASDRAFADALSPKLEGLLDALSPERVARDLRGRLIVIHGRADRAVPYTEGLRLAAAGPASTRLALVGTVEHVEGGRARWGAGDLFTLGKILYSLVTDN